MDPVAVAVLLASNSVIRAIFAEILKNRSATFKDLLGTVEKSVGNVSTSRREIEDAVSKLKEADLIKERAAPIEDFNSYYVTANGLAAERNLSLVANSLQ